MTGFATFSGEIVAGDATFGTHWELRSVNGRGLDLRFRLPEGLDGLEAALRKQLGGFLHRGNVTLSLKVNRLDGNGALRLNPAVLDSVLTMLAEVETRADSRGLALAPMTASDLLGVRGVLETGPEASDPAALVTALVPQAAPLIADFCASRAAEGQALKALISAQIEAIETLIAEAEALAVSRRAGQADTLRAALARLGDAAPSMEPARLEQELALIALRGDITEELDRLRTHCTAGRALLAEPGAVGRKLEFLTQEFNREANTLCSKAQHAGLTRIGLDLKAVIDQMREQVQNLE